MKTEAVEPAYAHVPPPVANEVIFGELFWAKVKASAPRPPARKRRPPA